MFSGSNPSADLYWANALAQSQSQNNSLDWALLAQQWISHQQNITSGFEVNNRNNTDFVSPADAPPAPKIVIKNNEEQGEADMDVEDDSPDPPTQNFVQSQPPPQIWSISSAAPINISIMQQQVPSTTMNTAPWNIWNTTGMLNTNLPPPALHIPELASAPLIGNDKINKPPVIPSLMDTPVNAPIDSQFPTLDAAKRKTLPAWIREGLEKMEREKQKQLEKEKAAEVTDNKYDNQSFIESLQTADNIGSNRTNKISSNYKGFLKNSAASSDESNESDSESDIEKSNLKKDTQIKTNPWHGKTREEIEEEMMLVVRRSLTEILLEITNEEIRNIAQETFKRHKLKASSAQVIRKSALTSISGNLGLGAYDSDSSNNSDTDDEVTKKDDNEYDKDSEDEIREKMISRQRAFKSIAREIDILVEKEEARQEEIRLEHLRREQLERSSERLLSQGGDNDINNEHSSNGRNSGNYIGNSSGVDINVTGQLRRTHYDREFGETHHDKKSYSSNGQKRLKERTSRFSDNKESKNKPSSSSSNSSTAGYLLSTSTNALNSTNLLNSTTSSTNKLLQHQQPSTSSIGSSAQILSNSAAQNFLMANEVLSKAFSKNDKKKSTLSSTSSNKRNKRDKKSHSRSRSRSSNNSSSSTNNSDEKSSHSSRSSKTTTSSSNTSNSSSKSSQNKKLNKHKSKKSKSRDLSNEFDNKSKQNRYRHKSNRNNENYDEDDDRLDSGEYNHGRSHYYHNYHYNKTSSRRSHSSEDDRSSIRDDERSSSRNYYDNKYTGSSSNKKYDRTNKETKDRTDNDDDDYRRQKRQHDNSPDSDDYYRSSRHRYNTNSSSSRSSSHRNDKKDYYSKSSDRKRTYSRREDTSRSRSRSKSKSKSYSSKEKHY